MQRIIDNSNYIVDKDAQFNEPAFNKLTNLHTKIERAYLQEKVTNPTLTEDDYYRNFFARPLTREADELMEALRKEWSEVTLFERPENFTGERLWNFEQLDRIQGMSPLQIRTTIKLEAMLRSKGVQHLEDKMWKVSRAVFAASRSEVGSLRTVSLSHQLLNMPAVLIAPEGGLGVMLAPWQEQMGRVQDPEVFLRRFSVGGEAQGQEIWANLIINELNDIDVKLESGDTFVPAQTKTESFGMRKARTLLLKSRRYYGVGYTELPRAPLGTSITLYDGTSWRFVPTLAKLEEVYGIDGAEHVGMGMRIAVHGKPSSEDGGNDFRIRKKAWWFTAKRTPSELIKNMMTEQTDQILINNGLMPGSEEWKRFNNILSVVENRIQTVEQNVLTDINLGARTDFDTYFSDEVFQSCNVTDPTEITGLRNHYYDVIRGFQHTFLEEGPKRGLKYIDLWAKRNFSITVSISDYDIGYTQWEMLPSDHHFRRVVSDATGHLGVLDQMTAFLSKPELSQQPDPQKVVEADGLLKAAAIVYSTTKEAERIMLTMDDAVTTYMESKNFYRWARALPIGSLVFRQLAGIDTEKWWARAIAKSVRPVLNFIANNPLLVRSAEERRVFKEILKTTDIKEWPRKFAQLHLGPTIAATGPQGTTWDPIDVDKHFDELEHAGLVIENHKLFNKMKDKHKSRIPWKFLALGQRYWWVPIVATVAVGVIIALEEQGIESKGK